MTSVIPAQQDILLMTICSLLFPWLLSPIVHIGGVFDSSDVPTSQQDFVLRTRPSA